MILVRVVVLAIVGKHEGRRNAGDTFDCKALKLSSPREANVIAACDRSSVGWVENVCSDGKEQESVEVLLHPELRKSTTVRKNLDGCTLSIKHL